MKAIQELQTLIESGEYCEFTVEWIRSEEQVEHSMVIIFPRLPVCVRHCNLVQIYRIIAI